MADNFILPGARQDGSTLGVVISATNVGTDAQGRAILAVATGAPAGSATSAKQDTQITAEQAILAAINAKFGALGQALMAGSAPVVIASNQSAIPVTGTFWQATQPVSLVTVADNAVSSGDPLYVGGLAVDYNESPAFTTGDRAALRIEKTTGGLKVYQIKLTAADDSVTATPQSVTPNVNALGASESQVIPIGAKGWSFAITTGTATVNGETVLAGVGDSDSNTLLATITVTTAAASTAYVRWNT